MIFWLGVFPGDLCLGWVCLASVVCALLVGGLWSPSFCGRPLVGLGGCVTGVVFISCGLVFSLSLCGGDMMSGLLPRINPCDSVSCVYQNFLCTLSIEPLSCFPYLPFFVWLFFQGIFVYYVIYFSVVKIRKSV